MDINSKISALLELYNQRQWVEAEKMLEQIEKSFHYGMGRDNINWKSFFNLTHIIRTFSTDAMDSKRKFELVAIETRCEQGQIE